MNNYTWAVNKVDSDIFLKISSEILELNIVLSFFELMNVTNNITQANWGNRQAIKAGICLNANVYWCYNDEETFSILIGEDDEIWEIGLKLPLDIINEWKDTFSCS